MRGRSPSGCVATFGSAPTRPCGRARSRGRSRASLPSDETHPDVYVSDIVGAGDVSPGQVRVPAGVVIRGNRLTVRLTRPGPDTARMTMPFFCAVPPNLPSDAEGLGPYSGSGPTCGRVRRPPGRPATEPVLPRESATPRREHRRRARRFRRRRADRTDRAGTRGLGAALKASGVLRPSSAHEVRREQVAILPPAGPDPSVLHPQPHEAAVSEQPPG